jgi:hypothetical protein
VDQLDHDGAEKRFVDLPERLGGEEDQVGRNRFPNAR